LVESLVRHAPIVVFSAAIPRQGGTDHLNEQWPDYWAEQFADWDFVAIDCLRHRLWNDREVEWYYAQNMVMFVRRDLVAQNPVLWRDRQVPSGRSLARVHPRHYLETVEALRTVQRISSGLATLVPFGSQFVLVDDGYLATLERRFGIELTPGRRALPFLERDGEYWGAAPDSETAIRELGRLREAGASFIAFAWTALWWLDYFVGFASYLRSEFPCLIENGVLVVFDLRGRRTDVPIGS
jgi:hypothetical protein